MKGPLLTAQQPSFTFCFCAPYSLLLFGLLIPSPVVMIPMVRGRDSARINRVSSRSYTSRIIERRSWIVKFRFGGFWNTFIRSPEAALVPRLSSSTQSGVAPASAGLPHAHQIRVYWRSLAVQSSIRRSISLCAPGSPMTLFFRPRDWRLISASPIVCALFRVRRRGVFRPARR